MRLLRFVNAQPVWGTQKNSKWSFVSTSSSMPSSTLSTRIGCSSTVNVNAGTTCNVTVDTIPTEPRPTRAQWNTSGSFSASHATTEPSPVTMRIATIWAASPRSAAPVPWVPVDVAPATV